MATVLVADQVPAHVPPERVRRFDIYGLMPGAKDMIESAAQVAGDHSKLFYTPMNGGHWVVTGYNEAARCTRATDVFSSYPYGIPTNVDEPQMIPIQYDPPDHAKYRAIFAKLLTPKMAMNLRGHIRASAVALIEDLLAGDTCDFVKEFSELLPATIFLGLMGLPSARLPEYREAVTGYLGTADIDEKQRVAEWMAAELGAEIAARWASPTDDLIGDFIRSEVEGRPLTTDEVLNMCMLIFLAGLDTVVVSLAYGMRHLAQDQALQAAMRADPRRVPELVEELLRRFSPAQPGRTIMSDTVLDGVQMKQGDRVFVMLAAANLDDTVFSDPLTVRLDRAKAPHLAFGAGPHRCSGMHLARIELQIAYEECLARLPAFRVDTTVPLQVHGGHMFSMDNLPLRWD